MPTINIENVIIVMIVAVGYTLLFRRFAANYMGKKTKQQAVLLDKYATRFTPVRRLPPYGARTQYVLAFLCDKRTLKFEVSPWVFNTVKKNDKGVLTYQGTRFISFD